MADDLATWAASRLSFAALLRQHRQRARLTQAELANLAGVSVRAIRTCETGRAGHPRHSTLRLLTEALGLTNWENTELMAALDGQADRISPAQLPRGSPSFTGRADETARLDQILSADGNRRTPVLINISGIVGVGKTALAIHWSHRVADQFSDGHLYVNLRGFDPSGLGPVDQSQALAYLLRSLGMDSSAIPNDVEARAALYRSLVYDRRILVFLDDAASAQQVRLLLPAAPGCVVVITSRARLTGLEGINVIDLGVFETPQAIQLLERVAGKERVSAEQDYAVKIVDKCGGLPLAVQIAAARLAARPSWKLRTLYERLANERHCLNELSVDDLEVRGGFTRSYDQLTERQRLLFRRLGHLPYPEFPDWVAMPLLDLTPESAWDALEALAEMRLIDPIGIDEAGSKRYRFHHLLQVFARERAVIEESDNALNSSLARLCRAFLHLPEEADVRIKAPAQLVMFAELPGANLA
jgi:transcriptional regulator with XRE-family HTH domain